MFFFVYSLVVWSIFHFNERLRVRGAVEGDGDEISSAFILVERTPAAGAGGGVAPALGAAAGPLSSASVGPPPAPAPTASACKTCGAAIDDAGDR